MEGGMKRPARLLLRSALILFLVTIVIGILNGLDVWDPSHEMLLTHVHAGTLGWITLSVVAVALLMFGENADREAVRTGTRLAQIVLVSVVLYVIAFATTTGVFRPIAGTLMLVAVTWALVWVLGRRRQVPSTVPNVALTLAMVSLVIGAVLGVLLGLYIATGSIPGFAEDTASNLGAAHPAAMLIGYLILAGVAISEWLLVGDPKPASQDKPGLAVAYGLFISGVIGNVAFISGSEPLIQAMSMLEVIGVVVFVVRMWRYIKPGAWAGAGIGVFPRMAVVFLIVGVGLLVYVVQLFVAGRIDPEAGEGEHILIAFDHAMFLGVMTNALLGVAALVLARVYDGLLRAVAWGFNIGLIGFLVGLLVDSPGIKRVSSPVLGVALMAAVYALIQSRRGQPSPA